MSAPLLAGLLLIGCGGGGGGGGPGAGHGGGSGSGAGALSSSTGLGTPTTGPDPGTGAASSPTLSASTTGPSEAPTGPFTLPGAVQPTGDATRGCVSSGLSVSFADMQGAAGHTYAYLVFTNTSRRTCVIGGYPGVSQVDAAGGQIGAPADRTGPGGRALPLAPGQQARATLAITTAGVQAGCVQANEMTPAVGLRIYPPENRAAMFLRFPAIRPACTNPAVHQLTVTALVR